nr:MAG TPA: hypothetical protein [Caudoviricetes sp.]
MITFAQCLKSRKMLKIPLFGAILVRLRYLILQSRWLQAT